MDERGAIDVTQITDGDAATRLIVNPQRAGAALSLDLGGVSPVCGVRMLLGTSTEGYPRVLSLASSADGATWSPLFEGRTAALTLRASLRNPREVWLDIPASSPAARFIRLRLEASHSTMPWVVADIQVVGTAP